MSVKSYILVVVLMALVFSMSHGHHVQGKGHKQWCSEDIGGACTPHDECPDDDVIDARCRGREVCCKIPDPCMGEDEICNMYVSAVCISSAACTGLWSEVTENPGTECCGGLVCCTQFS